MPVEVDVLIISPRLDQHRVAVDTGVDPLLDGGIVGRDVDDGGGGAISNKYYMKN
jgi:hypothetical protein